MILLLFIPDQTKFDDASASWTLLDGSGSPLRSGTSALMDIPRADRTIAVAPVNHLLFIETALPAVSPAKRDALLRYAIEDKLTIDPSTVHAVVLGPAADGKHVIAAIDKSWLRNALGWLQQSGIAPDSLVSSATAIPVNAGEWSVAIEGAHGFARRADGFVYNFDSGSGHEPPFGLTLALKEAREHPAAPSALALQSANAGLAAEWSQALGVPVKPATPSPNHHALLTASRNANLLAGEFAGRDTGSKWLGLLRPALIAAALIAATQFIFMLVDNFRINNQRVALEQEMAQVFKQAFPAAQAIVDAPLQMKRNLEQLKSERGMASEGDARALISQLTQMMQSLPGAAAVVALRFENGVATLDADLPNAELENALNQAVAATPNASISRLPGTTGSSAARVRISVKAGS
ncbi:MAG: hypothetical protein JNN20_12965 [Betaproteobacteria bacterium]|nr:hypothetical protein [Betaproteobacteria bacterium]